MVFGRKAKPDINDVSTMLTAIGLNHRFDEDGDITLLMRLAGRVTRERDGAADWEPLRYEIQPDWTISGEFTGDMYDRTDMARRVVRIHLIGSDLRSGKLKFQAFPKVVPEKFQGSAYIDVSIPTDGGGLREYVRLGMRPLRFPDGSTGVVGAVTGTVTEADLKILIDAITTNVGELITTRFTGVMVQGKA